VICIIFHPSYDKILAMNIRKYLITHEESP
jgi:hypothetical protein